MLANIIQNWGFMRVIRLALGVYAMIEAVKAHELFMGMLGLLIAGMALFNMGCGVPMVKNTKTKDQNQDDVEYEEVHSK